MSLKDVIGQDRAVRILSGMLDNNRIASSYLFAGPAGVGKKFTALQFIKAINCLENKNDSLIMACDICNSCKKTDSQLHPDVRIINPDEGVIKIDRIRELAEFLSFTPSEGNRKIIVVDDADRMNPNAGNAFLKILEEPPLDSTIILISSKAETLLDTILSRCIKINFGALPIKASKIIVKNKGVSFSDDQIDISMGSVGRLLSEDLFSKREKAFTLFKNMLYHKKIEQWSSREEMSEWFDMTLSFLRDMGAIKISNTRQLLINSDKEAEISEMCRYTDIKGIIKCYERLETLSRNLMLNLNKSIVLNYTQSILQDTLLVDTNKEKTYA